MGFGEYAALGSAMQVFVSYSRADVDFADQIALALGDRGFDALMDRHEIRAGEPWKERLGALIANSDAVLFILTKTSAASEICKWEVNEAGRLAKRVVPLAPAPVSASDLPSELGRLNFVHFYSDPGVPGSGFYDGLKKIERALRQNEQWIRRQAKLLSQAMEWREYQSDDLLLRGEALRVAREWVSQRAGDDQIPRMVDEFIDASARNEHSRTFEQQRAEEAFSEEVRILAEQKQRLEKEVARLSDAPYVTSEQVKELQEQLRRDAVLFGRYRQGLYELFQLVGPREPEGMSAELLRVVLRAVRGALTRITDDINRETV